MTKALSHLPEQNEICADLLVRQICSGNIKAAKLVSRDQNAGDRCHPRARQAFFAIILTAVVIFIITDAAHDFTVKVAEGKNLQQPYPAPKSTHPLVLGSSGLLKLPR